MKAIGRICVLAVAGAWCLGCTSDDNGAAPEDGGADVTMTTTGDSATTNTEASTTTETIGTSGGTVSAQGVDLTIPAGAVPNDVAISITPNAGPIPAGYSGLSPLYSFGPDGTVFLKPITVNFALGSSGPNPTVYWSNASGSYDPLATTVTAGAASASVTHFSTGFVAVGPASDDAGTDATVGPDAAVEDASSDDDVTVASDSSVSSEDSSAAPDAESLPDAATADAGASDTGASDATADVILIDGGIDGFTVTVDGAVTIFASSPSSVDTNGIVTIQANDNASSTYWQLQIVVLFNQQQQVCSSSLEYARLNYTHFTSGVADQAFSAANQSGSCNLLVTTAAQGSGQVSSGRIISATVYEAADAGTASHTFATGTFNVLE